MNVAEVSINVDEMETFINHALLEATQDPATGVSCVGNTVTINTSRNGKASTWEQRRLRNTVQDAIQRLAPGCEITWKS